VNIVARGKNFLILEKKVFAKGVEKTYTYSITWKGVEGNILREDKKGLDSGWFSAYFSRNLPDFWRAKVFCLGRSFSAEVLRNESAPYLKHGVN